MSASYQSVAAPRWFALFFFVAVVMCVSPAFATQEKNPCQKKPQAKAPVEQVRIDLKLKKKDDVQLLVVTLTNISKKAITVDRELVFFLGISPTDENYRSYRAKVIRDVSVGKWTARTWKKRMVTLKPGKSLSRSVDIYGVYKRFDWTSTPLPASDVLLPVGENMVRIKEKPTMIIVNYWRNFQEPEALDLYARSLKDAEMPTFVTTKRRGIDLVTGKVYSCEEIRDMILKRLREETK